MSSPVSNSNSGWGLVKNVLLVGAGVAAGLALYRVLQDSPERHVAGPAIQQNGAASQGLTRNEELIKQFQQEHHKKVEELRKLAKAGNWAQIRAGDYDMMFLHKTQTGTYQFNAREFNTLKAKESFKNEYREGIDICLQAWGWDSFGENQQSLSNGGKWGNSQNERNRLQLIKKSLTEMDQTRKLESIEKLEAAASAPSSISAPRDFPPEAAANNHEFVGVEALKQKHAAELVPFKSCERAKNWNALHGAHFDWWMFPTRRSSAGHGWKYALTETDLNTLRNDSAFMKNYREGVRLCLQGWGWDTTTGRPHADGGEWNRHDIRLYKVLESLKYFGEKELFDKVAAFARHHNVSNKYIDYILSV